MSLRGIQAGTGMTANGIYAMVGHYAKAVGIEVVGLGIHGLRATAATNALEHEADITKVQALLGHPNISTTRIYGHLQNRPEDSLTAGKKKSSRVYLRRKLKKAPYLRRQVQLA